MRATIFSLMAAGLVYGASAIPAQAYDYPYCLQSRSTGIPGECSYQTYAQCQASASGRLATCNINPRVAFGQQQRWPQQRYSRRARDRGYEEGFGAPYYGPAPSGPGYRW